ncbi:MAG TPA: adenylate/guanylate cyclase domain-containing protein [Opitutaceae bacterium]|jgi:adenylate cyclase|nr:adenylate/guanylate cyclase domain-containing protein [Opitutaceae bacterium]
MVKFLTQRAKAIVVVVGILAFGLTQTHWVTNSDLWQKWQGALIDRRYSNRAGKLAHPDIKLVGLANSTISMDELAPEEIAASPTLQLMQQPWPWDRRVYAAVLEKLMAAGAKVVVFDFVLAAQTDGDGVFAQALKKYQDHVVIGSQFSSEEANGEVFQKYTLPNPQLLLPGTDHIVGMVNLWADPDGVERRGRYRTSIERETPQLRKYAGTKYPDDLIHMSALAVEKFTGHVRTPPYDRDNFIDFRGPAGTYDALPMEKMFVEKLWQAPPFNGGSIFRDKIVVVGPFAEIFHDIHVTPFGDMPGPEVQAQMMATLLDNSSLGESSPIFDAALTLLMLGLTLAICLWIRHALLKALLLAGTAIVFLVGCQIAFGPGHCVLLMMPPLFCLVTTGSFGVVFQFALEQIERRRYRSVLDRYVSKNVARTILDDKRSFEEALRGRKQPVTILFSDIRGFTTMTESTDAEKLVAQLNEYFLSMVGIVLQEEGTLQKFIGDAIMAAWGDTHSDGIAVDARHAVNAALQMRPALAKLNDRWKDSPDRAKWAIGIGVNHGEVIVGNIGHPQRMEFTVLGDGVNLAARLESATKQFHTDILIGEETEKLTRDQFVYRGVDLLTFKGKTNPVEVFGVLSDRSQPPPAWLATYHDAIILYRGRQFAEAIARFEAVQKEIGGEDFLCTMYLGRCADYIKQRPPGNWDGSYTLSEK